MCLNEATIKKYIQEQEKHDIAMDKLSVKEYEAPYRGEQTTRLTGGHDFFVQKGCNISSTELL